MRTLNLGMKDAGASRSLRGERPKTRYSVTGWRRWLHDARHPALSEDVEVLLKTAFKIGCPTCLLYAMQLKQPQATSVRMTRYTKDGEPWLDVHVEVLDGSNGG